MHKSVGLKPRRRSQSEIKLLRLDLKTRGDSPTDFIGFEWSSAQPMESLSPLKASEYLKVEQWAPRSLILKRYRKLQLRFPPEQFTELHINCRPSTELLGEPEMRLNWYWQSGRIPFFYTDIDDKSQVWNKHTVEPEVSPDFALKQLLEVE